MWFLIEEGSFTPEDSRPPQVTVRYGRNGEGADDVNASVLWGAVSLELIRSCSKPHLSNANSIFTFQRKTVQRPVPYPLQPPQQPRPNRDLESP